MSFFELFKNSYSMQIGELQSNGEWIDPDSVEQACELILQCKGKLVCSGMGKSGLIAQKLAATFSSTGTPAFFLHPGESLHGDLGVVQPNDVILLLAKSGESDEVVQMLQVIRKMGNPVISLLGNPDSSAGRMSTVIIRASVSREADSLNLAPTASTTVSLVVGDALATAISEKRGFQPENFALYHPAGQLDKRLLLKVEDLLDTPEIMPVCDENATMIELLEAVTRPNQGGAMIVNQKNEVIGLVTDGDIRRAILKFGNVLERNLKDIMTANPIAITRETMALDALRIMEDRPSQISVIPVIDENKHPVGLLRIHDLVRAGL